MKRNILLLLFAILLPWGLLAASPAFADCPDGPMACWGPNADNAKLTYCGNITIGTCLQFVSCLPCNKDCGGYVAACNAAHPNCCQGGCFTSYKSWAGHYYCGSNDWSPPYNPN